MRRIESIWGIGDLALVKNRSLNLVKKPLSGLTFPPAYPELDLRSLGLTTPRTLIILDALQTTTQSIPIPGAIDNFLVTRAEMI